VVVGCGQDEWLGDLLKVRAMGVNATRRVAVWAVRRSWKGIVVFVFMSGWLVVVDGQLVDSPVERFW